MTSSAAEQLRLSLMLGVTAIVHMQLLQRSPDQALTLADHEDSCEVLRAAHACNIRKLVGEHFP